VTPAGPDILALEAISARAWPAARERRLGGWRLYASSGFSGRINACWPLGDPARGLDEAIDATEAWYASHNLPCRFKIVDAAGGPATLAARLLELGYRAQTETVVMVGTAVGTSDPAVALDKTLDPLFASVFAATADGPGDAKERLETLGRVPSPRAFARLDVAGAPAAIGACAAESDWAGVFAMRTDPRFRRQGLASRTLSSLMAFAAGTGATRAWLQVEADNAGAIALYRGAGFAEAYRYRYWRR
jgi:GNAT superfamily N-acetyltransferase